MRARAVLPRYGAEPGVDAEAPEQVHETVTEGVEAGVLPTDRARLPADVVDDQRLPRVGHRPPTGRPHQRLEAGRARGLDGLGEAREPGVPPAEHDHRRGGTVDPHRLLDLPVACLVQERAGESEVERRLAVHEGAVQEPHAHIIAAARSPRWSGG